MEWAARNCLHSVWWDSSVSQRNSSLADKLFVCKFCWTCTEADWSEAVRAILKIALSLCRRESNWGGSNCPKLFLVLRRPNFLSILSGCSHFVDTIDFGCWRDWLNFALRCEFVKRKWISLMWWMVKGGFCLPHLIHSPVLMLKYGLREEFYCKIDWNIS